MTLLTPAKVQHSQKALRLPGAAEPNVAVRVRGRVVQVQRKRTRLGPIVPVAAALESARGAPGAEHSQYLPSFHYHLFSLKINQSLSFLKNNAPQKTFQQNHSSQ